MSDPDLRRKFARLYISGENENENYDPLKRTNPFLSSCDELDRFLVRVEMSEWFHFFRGRPWMTSGVFQSRLPLSPFIALFCTKAFVLYLEIVNIFFGVPHLATCIFLSFHFLNEPGLGTIIDSGMALTLFESIIGWSRFKPTTPRS